MNCLTHILERYFSSNIGADHVVFTGLTRTAIAVSLKALGVSAGDEVIIPAFMCSAVEKAVLMCGATPVYVDSDQGDINITVEGVSKALSERTKAVIVSHTYGYDIDVKAFRKFCDENKLFLIEDCVSSFAVDYKYSGKKIFGDVAVFSIYKMLINTGGGFLVTNKKDLASRCRQELIRLKERAGRSKPLRRIYSDVYVLSYSIFKTYGVQVPFYTKLVKLFRGYHRKQLKIDSAGCDGKVIMTKLEYCLTLLQLPFLKWHLNRRSKAGKLVMKVLGQFDELRVLSVDQGLHPFRDVLIYPGKERKDKFVQLASKRGLVMISPWIPLASLDEALKMSDGLLLFPIRPMTYARDISRLRETLIDLNSEAP